MALHERDCTGNSLQLDGKRVMKNSLDAPYIVIGIPTRLNSLQPSCNSGSQGANQYGWSPEFAMSLLQLTNPLNTTLAFKIERSDLPAKGREIITRWALQNDAKYIFFLDDDVLFPNNTLIQFLETAKIFPDAGIISGLYGNKTENTEPFFYKRTGEGAYWGYEQGKVEEVESCGAGCMLVNMEYVKKLTPPYWTDEYTQKGRTQAFWGQDINFCKKIREQAGGKVYIDANIFCGHYDSKTGKIFQLPKKPQEQFAEKRKLIEKNHTPSMTIGQQVVPAFSIVPERSKKENEVNVTEIFSHRGEREQEAEVDIIIACWNQLEHTKTCLNSVLVNTHTPFHLILIDNGSTDGTFEYLYSLQNQGMGMTIIKNSQNLGWPKAMNQAIQESKALYICFLNNDTVVTKNWLKDMSNHFWYVDGSVKEIIAVVPTLDVTSGRQRHIFNTGEDIEETIYLTGHCIFIKRKAVNELEGFDESFGNAQVDIDFAIRLRKKGYRMVIARDVFVKHYGKASLRHLPEFNTTEFQEENFVKLGKLRQKWGDKEIDALWQFINRRYDKEKFEELLK